MERRGEVTQMDRRGWLGVVCALGLGFAGCAFGGEDGVAGAEEYVRPGSGTGLYPDMRAVVPRHLQIQNSGQQEFLRFSNGVANTGAGDLRVRPGVGDPTTGTQPAIQEILDANRNIVQEFLAGNFVFHPSHNHWHLEDVALFEVHQGSPTGPVYGTTGVKVTFCLIDWIKIDGNTNTRDRIYWDCQTSFQGIQPGWVDQYHHSLPGQEVDITGAPAGLYYFSTTANPDGIFRESNYTNNNAWIEFRLTRDSNGNAQVTETGVTSPCESPGMCGENSPNR